MEDRVEHERDQEFETALSQVHEIDKAPSSGVIRAVAFS